MHLDNNASPFPGNGENFTAKNPIVNLPVSNLSVDVDKNQFSNLFLPGKYIICSNLDTQDFGIVAAVNKSFNEVVFPKTIPAENNPFSNYRGFLCYTLLRRFLDNELPGKLLGCAINMKNNMSSQEVIDQKDLIPINEKIRSFYGPIISQISNIYASEIFKKKNVTNKDLLEMIALSKNPIFNKMFNLAGEIVIDTFPTIISEFSDNDLAINSEALAEEFEQELEAARDKSKAKNEADILELKDEKVSRFANIHFELKNRVPEEDPIPDLGALLAPAPIVVVIPPVGGFSGILSALPKNIAICAIIPLIFTGLRYSMMMIDGMKNGTNSSGA